MSSASIADEPAPLSGLVARVRDQRGRPALFVAALLAVAAPASAGGGYFPTSWGWTSVTLAWVAVLALAFRREPRLSRLAVTAVAAWCGLAVWTGLSALWSTDLPQTVLELERVLVPIAGLLAVIAVVRAADVQRLLGGALAGITLVCAYALATRLFPDRVGSFDSFASYRLAAPFGYWNALGIFAAIGVVLALGCAARSRTAIARAAAGAAPVLLLLALYFTFSRGAWIALVLGLAGALALDSRRLQLLTALIALAPAPALAVLLASRSDALTRPSTELEQATLAGERLAIALLALLVLGAATSVVLGEAQARVNVGWRVRLAAWAVVAIALLAFAGAGFARYGGPLTLAEKAHASFTAPPVRVGPGEDLNRRLFSLSSNGRTQLWRGAWADAASHPWLGSGAGSYEQYWLEHRDSRLKVRDAHSLYVETLSELGPAGLVLLLAALGLPLAAAIRARSHPLVPAAFGAYVAYLAHAGVDWDWELSALSVLAVLIAGALLAAGPEPRALGGRTRGVLLGLAVAVAALGLLGLAGNAPLAAAEDAARTGRWAEAERHARTATRWNPWSAAAWQVRAEAQAETGRPRQARESLRRALELAPRDWVLWYDLGNVSRGDARRQAYERAAALNPLGANVGVLRLLGYAPVTKAGSRR